MASPKLWLLAALSTLSIFDGAVASPLGLDHVDTRSSFPATTPSAASLNLTSSGGQWSTRMLESIISRQQGLVSSGEATSTLESGLISLSIQSWLSLYASSASSTNETVASEFASYVDAILQGISATNSFTNVSVAAKLPLDRLTVAQAIAGVQREPASLFDDAEDGEDGLTQPGTETSGGGRQLTASEALALSAMNESLAVQERNQYGGFWYYVYPSWSYLDGAVSFLPFMASPHQGWSSSDALLQIRLLFAHCYQNDTGLLAHGYDASRTAVWADPTTGASPWAWGRSIGWYMAGLVNAWEVLTANQTAPSGPALDASPDDGEIPASCAGQIDCAALLSTIQSQFSIIASGLLRWQDATSGAWWQLPTAPGEADNYLETSSTALFAFSLLKSLRLGLLSDPQYSSSSASYSLAGPSTDEVRSAALRAHAYLVDSAVVQYLNGTLGYDGTVAVCSLNSTASYAYYTSQPVRANAPLGEAAFVLASLEVERLGPL